MNSSNFTFEKQSFPRPILPTSSLSEYSPQPALPTVPVSIERGTINLVLHCKNLACLVMQIQNSNEFDSLIMT